MLVFVCFLDDLIVDFCYINLSLETGGLASTITLVLQANRLTKRASHLIDLVFKIGLNTLVAQLVSF